MTTGHRQTTIRVVRDFAWLSLSPIKALAATPAIVVFGAGNDGTTSRVPHEHAGFWEIPGIQVL